MIPHRVSLRIHTQVMEVKGHRPALQIAKAVTVTLFAWITVSDNTLRPSFCICHFDMHVYRFVAHSKYCTGPVLQCVGKVPVSNSSIIM